MRIVFALALALTISASGPLPGRGASAADPVDDVVRSCQTAYESYLAASVEARPSLAAAAKDVCTSAMTATGLSPDAFFRTYLSGIGAAAPASATPAPSPTAMPLPTALPLATATPVPGATPAPVTGRMPLGTNVAGPDDWSTELSFADVFKMSRRWFSGSTLTWQDDRTLDLDDHGWVRSLQPGQVARTLLFWPPQGMQARFPSGTYVFEHAGNGTIQTTSNVRRTAAGAGRETWDIDATHGVGIFITATDPADPIRDMHLWLPGLGPSAGMFNPTFVDRIRAYRVIRFLNWDVGQNHQEYRPVTWDQRPLVEDARWNVRGVPVEVQVDLANLIGADPWFNIPHTASDDYVRAFALAVRDRLDPRSKVYVEHSDEIWNYVFPVASYAQERGLALGLSTDPFRAQLYYNSLRSTQIFSIFEEVFPRERLVRVLASQFGNPWVSEQQLAFGHTAAQTDVLAVAPYFDFRMPELAEVATYSLDRLFTELRDRILPERRHVMAMNLDVARRYGVGLVAYEGGQSLVPMGPERERLATLFLAANRDPRMGALYDRYLRDWNEVVGTTFVHLANCFAHGGQGGSGYFGSLEYIDQPREEAYKYDALMRWIEGR